MSDTIWPGQKVDGHPVDVTRVSHSQGLWQAQCACGWRGGVVERKVAFSERDDHLRAAVAAGARIHGGGREAPTG